MARIEASTHVEASARRVWDVLVDWERQPAWMVDARSVEVVSPHREGVEVVLRCRTDIAGLVITDDMATTSWEPERTLGVRHLGQLVRGVGAFELEPTAHGTLLTWWEEVEGPFGVLGDAVTDVVFVPWIRRTFRRSLANLKRRAEAVEAMRG